MYILRQLTNKQHHLIKIKKDNPIQYNVQLKYISSGCIIIMHFIIGDLVYWMFVALIIHYSSFIKTN